MDANVEDLPERIRYHLEEARIIADPSDPRRVVPAHDVRGKKILDVGCGIGQTLLAPEFALAESLHGIDIDPVAVTFGRRLHPHLHLQVASAEALPYGNDEFHLTFSRVAMPYTDVPLALAELHRVTKPGGRVWLTLHRWRPDLFASAVRRLSVKDLVDLSYVHANGLAFSLFGRCFRRPWRRSSIESVQTSGAMRRAMHAAGFRDIVISRERHFVVSAWK